MKTSSAKAKGRRLQVEVAELLAYTYGLTIEATPPTKPGTRNGAVYVGEDADPDLRVRSSSQPGVDVALLTARARRKVALHGKPLWIEAKNQECWTIDALMDGKDRLLRAAVSQTESLLRRASISDVQILVVLGRNRRASIAVFPGYRPLKKCHTNWVHLTVGLLVPLVQVPLVLEDRRVVL